MKYEKSAGAIVFREKGARGQGPEARRREYLLLARKARSADKNKAKEKFVWDFPKGLVEGFESERATAEREVKEETGLSEFSLVEGFRQSLRILYKWQGEFHTKTIIFFLAQATGDDVRISLEHLAFEWLNFEEARSRLTHKGSKELLQKAEAFLNRQSATPQTSLEL